MERAKGFFHKIIELIKKPELSILPGQLAFFLVMSLFPLVALIGTILSFFSISFTSIDPILDSGLPKEVIEIISSILSVQGPKPDFNMMIFFIMTFVLASKGTYSIITASNEIYKINDDSLIKKYLKAILMTFMLIMVLLFLLLIPVFGENIFDILRQTIGNNIFINFFYYFFKIIEYPLSIAIIYLNIKTIYAIAPSKKIEECDTKKGALFATVGWILASEIFSFYVTTFSKYNLFYGSISNVVILLIWVYILSYIFVIGMIINAGTYKMKEIKNNIDKSDKSNIIEN